MQQNESLVLVPGLMCDDTVWRDQIEELCTACDIQVADHGILDSLGAMADRILDNAAGRFSLAGHSMGGRVALEVVARAPDRVSRLALLDTGYQGVAPGEGGDLEKAGRNRLLEIAQQNGMRAMAEDWARGMVHPARLSDRPLMNAIHTMIVHAGIQRFEAQVRALLGRPDRTALLAEIRVPTLILCGRDDSWSPLERHEDMAQLISGSHLVDVPDCGHMCTMERPGTVTTHLLDWLKS
jgi:pimeloyl-ACP methyl ester carboxylesterase